MIFSGIESVSAKNIFFDRQFPAPRIFVVGFLGSDRQGAAEKLAAALDYRVVDLDREIEQADGRSILRICMTMGEHEYRNQEYQALQRLENESGIVVVCGDGIVLDEMSRDILRKNAVIVADHHLPAEALWERAKDLESVPYAFMRDPDAARRKEQFLALYAQREALYREFL